MLNNRVVRFIVGIISTVAVMLILLFAIGETLISDLIALLLAPTLITVVGLLLFDILNFEFMQNTFWRIVKLAIFYAVVLVCVLVSFLVDYGAVGGGDFAAGLLSAMAGSATLFTAGAFTIFARDDFLDEPRWWLTFCGVEGYAASVVLGLILGAIGGTTAYIIAFVISLVACVGVTVFFGLPFEYDDLGDWWCLGHKVFGSRRVQYAKAEAYAKAHPEKSSSGSSSSSGVSAYSVGNAVENAIRRHLVGADSVSVSASGSQSEGIRLSISVHTQRQRLDYLRSSVNDWARDCVRGMNLPCSCNYSINFEYDD